MREESPNEALLDAINIALQRQATKLVFPRNNVTSLPREIGQLTNLIQLNLSGNNLAYLRSEIGQLTNLNQLDLSRNWLDNLPRQIGKLINLTQLNLAGNKLTTLPRDIGRLNKLTTLKLSDNDLTTLPPEIGQLKNLTTLDLSNNHLTTLPEEISQMTKLNQLNLSGNDLTNLPTDMGLLPNLNYLDLSGNMLTTLPPGICQLQHLQFLDLRSNNLTVLPAEIGNLANLAQLNLRNNKLTSLPREIGNLSKLTQLNLRNNQLTSLPPEISNLSNLVQLSVYGNNLTQLPAEIVKLRNLAQLGYSDNNLTSLPPELFQLTNLKQLFLSHNNLEALPPEISQLSGLSQLDLRNNKLTAFPPHILRLKELTLLYLSNNKLTELPHDIARLSKLKVIYLQGNQLNVLPPEITHLSSLTQIPITGNPLVEPPIEIAKHGIKAIRTYFDSLKKEAIIPLSEVKVLFVGDGGSGKTSLMKLLVGEPFNPLEPQTHGINIQDWETNESGTPLHVHFWDFGGQQIMHATHQFFLSKRSLYILVLDGRKEEDAEYWLKHIESFGGTSPILVVLNKMDMHPSYDVNRLLLRAKYKGIKGFFPLSCSDQKGLEAFSKALLQELAQSEMLKTTWPKSWFEVKTYLERMEDDFISYGDYVSICTKFGIQQARNQEALLEFLNDLGVVLHFKDLDLFDTHVLEPRWITEAVYRILNSKELAESKGMLFLDSLSQILKPKNDTDRFYPHDRFPYIINLMKKFELCYEIDSSRILVTQLLDIQKPMIDFDYPASLKFFIEYDFLPKSVIARFIVHMHRDIKLNLMWRTGVVLEDPAFRCTAVVEADEKDKRIYVNVLGYRNRDYFAVLRHALFSINNTFEKIQAVEKVPMPDQPTVTVSYRHLLMLEELGEKTYIPDGSDKRYNVKELLGTIQTDSRTEEEILGILSKLKTDSDTPATMLQKANDIVLLQPNFFGLGININKILNKIFRKKK
jgi:internalin A